MILEPWASLISESTNSLMLFWFDESTNSLIDHMKTGDWSMVWILGKSFSIFYYLRPHKKSCVLALSMKRTSFKLLPIILPILNFARLVHPTTTQTTTHKHCSFALSSRKSSKFTKSELFRKPLQENIAIDYTSVYGYCRGLRRLNVVIKTVFFRWKSGKPENRHCLFFAMFEQFVW